MRVLSFSILIPLLIVLSAQYTHCQSPYFRKHSLPQEYRNTSITHVLQSKDRFLWLGTTNGLIRFDGVAYQHFLQGDHPANNISALYEDRSGVLWIGSKTGQIARFQNDHYLDTLPTKPARASITGFAEDSQGRVWCSTYGDGLYILNDPIVHIQQPDGLSNNYIYTIAADAGGKIWAGTDDGISKCSFENGLKEISVIDVSSGLPDNIVSSLKSGENGLMWIGLESLGLCQYLPQNDSIVHLTPQWQYGTITEILPMNNSIWVGTHTQGIININKNGSVVHPVSRPGKKIMKPIESLTFDSEGNVWHADGSSEVFSSNQTFTSVTSNEHPAFQDIQAVLQRYDGSVVFSSSHELFSLQWNDHEGYNISNLSEQFSLGDLSILSLYEDHDHSVWLGTFDQGVYKIDFTHRKVRHYTERDGLINNNVLSITGNAENLWLATLGGVSRLTQKGDKSEFTNFTSESGLGSNYIYKVFIDSKERIWFCTDGKGVTVLDQGKFTNFSLNNGLKSDVVYSVTESTDSTVWISTSNTGLYKFTDHAFQSFTPHNGLRDLGITSIVGDKNGNLLICNKDGIDILNPKTGTVFYHGSELGIDAIDPNLNAYCTGPGGSIWFGTQRGLIRYRADISPTLAWPETRITDQLLFLRRPENDSTNIFAHDENHISFHYIGFWYHDPEEVSYQIKLDGYDLEWINSRNRFATYPNLPPGDYTFMVRSSATNYFNGAPVQQWTFKIKPPFYNTILFYLLCTGSLSGVIILYIRSRERKIKTLQQREKEKIEFQFQTLKNQVNPHFLFNSFNALISVIEEDKDLAIEYVEKLSDFYRSLLLHREKEVISLHEELHLVDQYYFLQTKRYKNNFSLSVNIPQAWMQHQIPPLTLQLLLENALKHNIVSIEKPLEVHIFIDRDFLVIQNTLQRKLYSEPSTGLGLHNIINRYKLLTDQKVNISETPTHFRVEIPLLNH